MTDHTDMIHRSTPESQKQQSVHSSQTESNRGVITTTVAVQAASLSLYMSPTSIGILKRL
jgi:hypothetical protein